jgi:hypothetical protein
MVVNGGKIRGHNYNNAVRQMSECQFVRVKCSGRILYLKIIAGKTRHNPNILDAHKL